MQHIQTGKLPHSSTAGPSHGGDTSAYLAALAAVPRYSCQEKENRCYNYPHPQTLDHHRPLTSSPLALWSSSSSSSSPPGASMSSPPPSSDLDFDEVLRTPLQNTKYYNVDPTPSSSSSPLRSISANAQHLDTSSGFTKVPPARTHTSSSSSRSRMYKSTSSVRARDTMAPQTPAHGARSERIFFHATQRARGERGSIVDKRRNGLLGDAIRSGLETEEELAILRKQYRLDRARLERDFDMEQARSGSTLEEEVEEKQEEYARAGIAEETTQAAAGGAWMDHNNAQEGTLSSPSVTGRRARHAS